MTATTSDQFRVSEDQMEELIYHPLADMFPLMEGEAFAELLKDVREPITLLDRQILDGRNRYRAAREAGVKPPICDYNGSDPMAFVISANLHRRHLNESQRAMVASKIATARQGSRTDLKPRANLHEVSATQAGEILGVSERSVKSARAVRDMAAPNLIAAVESGEIAVSKAAKVAKIVPKEEQEAWTDVPSEVRSVVAADDRSAVKSSPALLAGNAKGKLDDKTKLRQLRAEIKDLKEKKARLATELRDEKRWHTQCRAKLAWAWEWADELERRSGALSDDAVAFEQIRILELPADEIRLRGHPFGQANENLIGPIDEARVKELAETLEKGHLQDPIPVRRNWHSEEGKWLKVWEVLGDPHLFEAFKLAGKETVPCVLNAGLAGLRLEQQYAEQCLEAGAGRRLHEAENVRRNTREELSRRIRAFGKGEAQKVDSKCAKRVRS